MRSESALPLHRAGAEVERLSYADNVISRARLDQLVALMGGGTLLFGVAPCLAPATWTVRGFARAGVAHALSTDSPHIGVVRSDRSLQSVPTASEGRWLCG
jgi:hypothetical protein